MSGRICVVLASLLALLGVLDRAVADEPLVPSEGHQAASATGDPVEERQSAKPARRSSSRRPPEEIEQLVVQAKKPLSSASAEEVREKDYAQRPHDTMIEILNNIPGLVAGQHQGGGKAPQWLIRGFDADHGTDFAVFADNLPVNLVSHAHGQGYADVNFIIPETIERFQLWKGPYFSQFGDFANAGALNFVTKETFRENFATAEGGVFGTQRYVIGFSPRPAGAQALGAKTLLAAQAYFTDGPFLNPQRYSRYNLFAKITLDPSPGAKLSVSATVYQGDWHGSGQIPLRLVSAGELDRFGSLDPSEGGHTDRENLDLHYTYAPTADAEWDLQVYASRYRLQLFSDFSFFRATGLRFSRTAAGALVDHCQGISNAIDCPLDPNATYLPGDGIEQNDQRVLYGGRASHTRYWMLLGRPVQTRIAVETRSDDIDVALHRQVQRQRFFTVNQLRVQESSVSAYLQHQVFFTEWLRLEAGLRGDVFFFDGDDRLPRSASTDPTCAPGTDAGCERNFAAVRIRGHANDSMVSPKVNLVVAPLTDTELYANFGTGFHSNDARDVLVAKAHPQQAGGAASALARSLGYELGARTRQFDRLDLAAALWLLDLQSELVFSGDVGRPESGAGGNFQPAGATRRWGVDFEARYQFTSWLSLDYDLSWADPRFRTGEVPGGAVPLAPTLLMNGGITTELGNGFSAALRLRSLGDRPANQERTLVARGYTILDLLGRYRWRNLEAQVSLLNLAGADWREAQFDDQSCARGELGRTPACALVSPLQQGGSRSNAGVDDLHFTPGDPFWVRGGVTVYF